jgi:PAS domain S-box-containing protein
MMIREKASVFGIPSRSWGAHRHDPHIPSDELRRLSRSRLTRARGRRDRRATAPIVDSAPMTTPDLLHEALLGEAVESAFFAITVYDDDGRMVAANRRAADLLGYPRDELLAYDVGAFTEGGFDRTRLFSRDMREGVRIVQRRDGTRFAAAFVVAPATLSGLPYFVSVWWQLAGDDARVTTAI